MAESMNGDFKKLLDEQKKSNELLSSINTGQQEQGTAKEIIKQSLPEVLNERQLHKQRMKFEKKTGKTEVDDKVEKQTKTIEKTAKIQEIKFGAYQKEINDYAKSINVSMDIIKKAQSATKGVDSKERIKAQKRLENIFKRSNEGEKIQIDLAQQNLDARRKQIEKEGGNAEKDALYKAEMLSIEKRKQRLARRNASGLAARSLATFKNIGTIARDLFTLRNIGKGILGGITGLTKGLFRGTGRVLGAGLSLGKKFALLAFLPALLAFLNSDTFEKMKVFLSENLIPAIKIFNERVLQPVKNFLINTFFDTFKNIKEAFGDKNTPNTLAYAFDQFKQGNIIEGIKSSVTALYNLFKNTVTDMFDNLLHDVLKPMFKLDIKDDDTFFGLIGGFFTKMLNMIKGFFTLETFANFYDQIPNAPASLNPFRAAINTRDESALNRREQGTYGTALTPTNQLQDFLGIPVEQQRPSSNFSISRFISRNPGLFSEREKKILFDFTLSDAQKLKKLQQLSAESFVDFPLEPAEPISEDRKNKTVIDDIRDIYRFFKRENDKVKKNAELLVQSIRNDNLITRTGRFGAFDSAVDLQMALKAETATMLENMSQEQKRAFMLKKLGITTNTDGSALVVSGSGNTEIKNETYEVHTKNIKSSDSHQSLASDLN